MHYSFHPPRCWICFCLLLALGLLIAGTGCANTPATVTADLAENGYAIWYPAESGIEPGQIWLYDGTLRAKFADRPASMPLTAPRPLHLAVEKLNDAKRTLSSTFTQETISKAGPFAAELNAGSVVQGTWRVGPAENVEILLGQPLLSDAAQKYGVAYATALDMVHSDTPGLLLIASVVRVPKVEYTLLCEDPFKLMARLPRIRDMVHARVDAEILDAHYIKVTFTPDQGLLVIGVTPVRGDRLNVTTPSARAALAHDLIFAQRQAYAFKAPVPNIIAPPEMAVISEKDSAQDVKHKYAQAIGEMTNPIATTRTPAGPGTGTWREPSPPTKKD